MTDVARSSEGVVNPQLARTRAKTLGRATSLPFLRTLDRHSTDTILLFGGESPPTSGGLDGKPSRFKEDFVELEQLGSGGFGTVHKVQNRLDGTHYAMKKITFKRNKQAALEKVLREVKALAKLDHPNIVRYYQAWIEEELVDPLTNYALNSNRRFASDQGLFEKSHRRPLDETSDGDDENDELDEDSAFTTTESFELANSPPEQLWNLHVNSISLSEFDVTPKENLSSMGFEWDRSFHTAMDDDDEEDDTSVDNNESALSVDIPKKSQNWEIMRKSIQRSVIPQKSVMLYIQMQLCEDTLQTWLEARTKVDKAASLSLFKQICKALKYIHAEGIIHRDLKPSNIFLLSRDQLRDSTHPKFQSGVNEFKSIVIGDFGLAVLRDSTSLAASTEAIPGSSPEGMSEISSSPPLEHTSKVGTALYSSPEQENEMLYDEKTDIYSLGIVFFELLYPLKTKMERARVLSSLRKHVVPADFLQNNPKESAFLLWLLSPSPSDRPSAAQILKHDIIRSETVTIDRRMWDQVNDKVKQQQHVIDQQAKQILEFQKQLAQLRANQ